MGQRSHRRLKTPSVLSCRVLPGAAHCSNVRDRPTVPDPDPPEHSLRSAADPPVYTRREHSSPNPARGRQWQSPWDECWQMVAFRQALRQGSGIHTSHPGLIIRPAVHSVWPVHAAQDAQSPHPRGSSAPSVEQTHRALRSFRFCGSVSVPSDSVTHGYCSVPVT